jgi:hypothetical protein
MLAYIPYMDPMGTDMYFNVHFFSSVVGRHGPATHRRVSSYSTIPQTMRTMRTMRMEKNRLGLQPRQVLESKHSFCGCI